MGSVCGLARWGRAAQELSSSGVPPFRVIRIDGDLHVVFAQDRATFRIEGDIPEFSMVDGRIVPLSRSNGY